MEFTLYILCMDKFSSDALQGLDLPRVHLIHLAEFEDDALRVARSNRTFGEYCWTCTARLLLYVLGLQPVSEVVTYVDADISFFSRPDVILNELGNKSIFIHEHDFAPEYCHLQAAAGRFNVGAVAVRNDEEGRKCLQRWNSQCLDDCTIDLATGKCGDQKYLDEWPDRYRRLVISANPGVGLGPWNIGKHRLVAESDRALVDDHPIVFYHFHALRIWRPLLGIKPILMVEHEYTFTADVVRAIYRPYARELWRIVSNLKKIGFSVLQDLQPMTAKNFHRYAILRRQLVFSVGMI
jgi:hypothetical protein